MCVLGLPHQRSFCSVQLVRDTSSNDTSSTTTFRRKFLSNYHFVEKVTSSKVFSSNTTLRRIFSVAQNLVDAMFCSVLFCSYILPRKVHPAGLLQKNRLKPFQLVNFRRKINVKSTQIVFSSFTHPDYSPNKIFLSVVLSLVCCACYIKMDEYSTPEFYKSTRQKDTLSYRGYRHHRDRVNGDREYWKCEDCSCRGRAVPNKREKVSVSEHAHGPNQAKTVFQKAVGSIKCSSESTHEAPSSLINREESQSLPAEFRGYFSKETYIKRAVQRTRNKRVPSLPKCLGDISISDKWAQKGGVAHL